MNGVEEICISKKRQEEEGRGKIEYWVILQSYIINNHIKE